ncbi:YidC/Oxa1 family membrane protein insertase [Nocardioides aequoreus]|uniref:YidC/Oxa1 family membrane protein insertase n=1 Tax=Nocardioides aequoreus TaxID=397278 RepID=UPI0004C42EA5|nr:YidC/Oxa1 family membrane protein insertase [Nocardioides aequoreus]
MSLLEPISHALAAILAGAHSALTSLGADPDTGPTWVACLTLLVVAVRLCLLPAAVHALRLTRASARARPAVRDLAARYRHRTDPDSVRAHLTERRRLNAEHGVSRLGCLPLLLQLPVWIALYQLVSHAALGVPTGPLDAPLVTSLAAATVAGVPLAASGYLGAGPGHLAVVAGLAGVAALLSFVTQRVFVAQNAVPWEPQDGTRPELVEALSTTQQLLPLVSAGGLLLAGGLVPVALLVYWVCSQAWTLAWSATVWRWWPTPGSPAAARAAGRAAAA